MIVRRPTALLLVSLLSLGASVATDGPARAATTWLFPSTDNSCPQPDGLQACIDKTSPGDTIEITLDPLDNQIGEISHSLTVKAAPGLDPIVGAMFVGDDGHAGALNVTIEGLTFLGGVHAAFSGGSGHTLTLKHVNVSQPAPPSTAGLVIIHGGITLVASAPSSLSVIGGRIQTTGGGPGISVGAFSSGLVSFQAIGNRISASDDDASEDAIDVEANSGSLHADIMNNAIWDVDSCGCGDPGAISLDAEGGAHVTANVVGNTIDHVSANGSGDPGLIVLNETTASGRMSVNVFNNVFAHTVFGINIEHATGAHALAFKAGYNDFFKYGAVNFLDGESIGSHNLFKDPKFVNEAKRNLELQGSSPVINKGEVCSPGGVADPDAAGHSRLHGSSVDMGAYELGAGAPGVAEVGTGNGEELDGTSGDDILCGMGGADLIYGNGGNDYLDGGPGADIILGGTGSDRLFGDAGNDLLCAKDGTHGNDHLDGGPGSDGYQADSGDVKVSVEHTSSCQLKG